MRPNNTLLAGVGALLASGVILPVWLAVQLVPADITRMHTTRSIAEAVDLFKDAGFDPAAAVHSGMESIPAVFVEALPADMGETRDTHLRKSVFVSIVLPHILRANNRIRADRKRLLRLQREVEQEKALATRDRRWLERLAVRYRTKPLDMEALLHRVDIVPPRLALAQAAQESGWGTSRFAQTGNALFGQHAPVGANAIAAKKAAGVALRAFENLYGSVEGYMDNLNGHRAYRGFRAQRAEMRKRSAVLDGYALAAALGAYSEEGTLYVQRLRAIMAQTEISAARGARLGTPR